MLRRMMRSLFVSSALLVGAAGCTSDLVPVLEALLTATTDDQTGQAAFEVHRNQHQGKVGVLCLAPEEGLGVRDPDKRAKFQTEINRFRNT